MRSAKRHFWIILVLWQISALAAYFWMRSIQIHLTVFWVIVLFLDKSYFHAQQVKSSSKGRWQREKDLRSGFRGMDPKDVLRKIRAIGDKIQ